MPQAEFVIRSCRQPGQPHHKNSSSSPLSLSLSLSPCLPSQLGVSPLSSNFPSSVIIWNCYLAADSQQYAPWNRTRRLRASPYLASADSNTSRTAAALATGVGNVPPNTNDVEATLSEPPKEKRQETLFGPNIGIISEGPAWAQSQDTKKSTSSDCLTPEIVRRWVEASKEVIISYCPSVIPADHNTPDHSANHHAAGVGQPKTSYPPAFSN